MLPIIIRTILHGIRQKDQDTQKKDQMIEDQTPTVTTKKKDGTSDTEKERSSFYLG